MHILSKYLSDHLFSSIIAFFIPLFGIASLIFFIKIVYTILQTPVQTGPPPERP